MKAAFFIFFVSCWTISQTMAAALSNNNQSQIGKKLSSKAKGALPFIHIVFDVASGANAQTLSGASRRLINALLPQNVAQNFESETMMSISSFAGNDSGPGNYLKVLSPPVNVVNNFKALSDIIQFEIPGSVTSDTNRDPGAAIRDALAKFSNQLNPDAADILYLVSRRYVDGGPTVKELEVIDTILAGSMTLICVEGANVNDPNRLLNLKRVSELTEGYYYTNTDTQANSWANKNDAAINLMLSLARSPINFVRRKVDRKEYDEVSDVSKTGSFLVTPDLGNNSVITIQSSQKGVVTVVLTNIQTGATVNLSTRGIPNWNMINANLYVDDLALSSAGGETRGRWTYALTFDPAIDALDTESDVVILGLSSLNTNPLAMVPGVSALSCNLDFPDQQSTIIYAEVIGTEGVLTGMSIIVTLKNVEDTSSRDVLVTLTEKDQGTGEYSGIFTPRSNGLYDFFAEFKADVGTVCTGGRCVPSDFFENAQGRCRIRVQGKVIDITTMDPATSTLDISTDDSTSTFDNTADDLTSTLDTTTDDSTSTLDTTKYDLTSTSETTVDDSTSTSDTTADDSTSTSDTTTNDPTITSDTITDDSTSSSDTTTEDSTNTSDTNTEDSTNTSDTITDDSTSPMDTTTDDSTSTSDTITYDSTNTADTITDDTTSTNIDTTTNDSISTSDTSTDDSTSPMDTITDDLTSSSDNTTIESTSTADTITDDSTSTMDTTANNYISTSDTFTDYSTSKIDTTTDDLTITSDYTTDEVTNTTVSTTVGPISSSSETSTTMSMTTTMESSLTPTSSSSTPPSTSSSTIPPANDPTVKQPPTAGFIIGLCLGIAFLIAFLLILLYCCCIAEKDKDEERESSVQEIPSTPSRRRFVQRWRLRWIPPAVLRRPPAITSSSLSTESMPYKTMDDDSTSTQPYRRINEKK